MEPLQLLLDTKLSQELSVLLQEIKGVPLALQVQEQRVGQQGAVGQQGGQLVEGGESSKKRMGEGGGVERRGEGVVWLW